MRILITGCTAMQVDSTRKVNNLISNLESIAKCLEHAGHEVQWDAVAVGEDLSDVDLVIISLAPMASWGSKYMGGALWALMTHPNVRLTADDWQVRGISPSCKGLWKRDDYFEKTIWSHWKDKVDESYRQVLKDAIWHLAHDVWPWKMIVPCWDGGDLTQLRLPSIDLQHYDPSPFMKTYSYVIPEEKHRVWIFASLTSKAGWLEKQRYLKWPVRKYGNVRQGQLKLPEHELAQVYAESWGVMSPPHDVSPAGWFRVRFWMSVHAGCVMHCDESEAKILGASYGYHATMVEQLPDDRLKLLAEDQRLDLLRISWSRDRMSETFNDFIKG